MATIQVRDIPEDAYDTIRERARAAGQSIQTYMREQVIALARRRSKEEAWAAVESAFEEQGSVGATKAQILRDLAADRR